MTAAPVAQPRNIIFGQALSGVISMCFSYIPQTILPVWLRVAIGPAFSIYAMVKFGVTHPPAGKSAFFNSSGFDN